MVATLKLDFKKLEKRLERVNKKALRRSGAYLRGAMQRSIKTSAKPSPAGQAPHTRSKKTADINAKGNNKSRGGQLKRSILYAASDKGVIVGASSKLISNIAEAHEQGGRHRTPSQGLVTDNWVLEVGGHGPLRFETGRKGKKRRPKARAGTGGKKRRVRKRKAGEPVIGKLRNASQVARAKRIANIYRTQKQKTNNISRLFPKRPFARPALNKNLPTVLSFWKDAV